MTVRSLVLVIAMQYLTGGGHAAASSNNYSAPATIVISQVYGGGGNSGAPFKNDFVELLNRGNTAVSLNGWALQYTSATGTTWSRADLSGTIAPGAYYLVQLAGGANGADLPAPNAIGTLAMAAGAGKVALTNSTTNLSGSCPSVATIVDLVGYGTNASCFEGSGPAPAPGNTLAVRRGGNGCQETDQNSADFATGAPLPRNGNAPPNPCAIGGGARFLPDDVRITVTSSGPCLPFTAEAKITNSGTRPQRDNPGAEFVAVMPEGLRILAGSCRVPNSGSCTETTSSIAWNGTLAPSESAVISWQLDVTTESNVPANELCFTSTVRFDANDDGSNEAETAVIRCATVTCLAGNPGIALPIESTQAANRPGSVLVIPFFVSNASAPQNENTRFSLTNSNNSRAATVHIFLIEDDGPSMSDMFSCLTPNQTQVFLASEIDPNTAGYAVVVAVDPGSGCPIAFNYLLGGAEVMLSSGHAGTLGAEAFTSQTGPAVVCGATNTTAELRFDGQDYSRAPRVLVVDNLSSPADDSQGVLIIVRLGGNLLQGGSTLGQLVGIAFNDTESTFSFGVSTSRRQLRLRINDGFPRTTPRFGEIVPSGRSGWMKVWLNSDGAILGALLAFNPKSRISAAAFSGGKNLHKLTLTDAARLTIPVFPPGC